MGLNKWMVVSLICMSAAAQLTVAAPQSGQVIKFKPITRQQYETILSAVMGKSVAVEPRVIDGYATLKNLQKGVTSTWQSLLNRANLFPAKEVAEKPSNAYPLCVIEASQLEDVNRERKGQLSVVNCVVVASPNDDQNQDHESPETQTFTEEASTSSENLSESNPEEENIPHDSAPEQIKPPVGKLGIRKDPLLYSSFDKVPYPYPVIYGYPAPYQYGYNPYAPYSRQAPMVAKTQPLTSHRSPQKINSDTEALRTLLPNSGYPIQYPVQEHGVVPTAFLGYPQYLRAFNPLYPQYFSHKPQYPESILRTLAKKEQDEKSESEDESEDVDTAAETQNDEDEVSEE